MENVISCPNPVTCFASLSSGSLSNIDYLWQLEDKVIASKIYNDHLTPQIAMLLASLTMRPAGQLVVTISETGKAGLCLKVLHAS
jgi:hypothetical protein